MYLAIRIRKIREEKGLSQADVAYKCGISPSAYGQIERKASKSSFETLMKIAKALDVSIHYLIDIDEVEYDKKQVKSCCTLNNLDFIL